MTDKNTQPMVSLTVEDFVEAIEDARTEGRFSAYDEIMENDEAENMPEDDEHQILVDRLDKYLDHFARTKLEDMKITKEEIIDAVLEKARERNLLN